MEVGIAGIADERRRIGERVGGVERPVGRELKHPGNVLIDVAVELDAVDIDAGLDPVAAALVGKVVDQLQSNLRKRLRHVRQLPGCG